MHRDIPNFIEECKLEVFLVVIALILLTLFYFYFLKDSVFGVNLARANYHGFFIFYSFFTYIFISSIILNIFPIGDFWVAFKVTQDSVFTTSVLILALYFVFLVTLFLMSIFLRKYFRSENKVVIKRPFQYVKFVRYSVLFCFVLMLVAWLGFGQGHSFSLALGQETSVSTIRSEIAGKGALKFVKYFYIIVCPLLFSILFTPIYNDRKYEKILLSLAVIFISAWGGSKSPILSLLLIGVVVHMTANSIRITIYSFVKVVIGVLILLLLTHQIVLFQYSHMENFTVFLDYFSQRVFVAQIIGVYEQFSIFLQDDLYFLHGVPFASFFIDYPIFQKDLMMVTEDRGDPSTIGIKNTFFIAEAYAMGGVWLLMLSPIIMGVNFSISFVVIYKVFNFLFPNNDYINKLVCSVFLFSYVDITGGFSDLMLFKLLIMLFGLLSPIWFFAYLAKYKVGLSTTSNVRGSLS